MEIKVKYHDIELEHIKHIKGGDWYDLRSAENVELKQFENKTISLGVSIEIPEGYEAHIAPRSSTYIKWGILQANSIGVIDNSYAGENDIWGFSALAMRDTKINKNDRICQFRIIEKQPVLEFIEVNNMTKENRGGFGHTGKN